MARSGVTYLDVAKTAIKLAEQKINPSIEEVRKALGTGSNSTINRYLREWRSKHGHQAEMEQGLPDSLLVAIRNIYDGIKEEATNKINMLDAESKQIINDLKIKLQTFEEDHAKLLQSNKALENTIDLLREEKLALQRNLDGVQQNLTHDTTKIAGLQEQLGDKKAEIVTLTQQLKRAQDNLDHYRETIRQTRETENTLFKEQIKTLERQLTQQQRVTEKINIEYSHITKQNGLLTEDKQSLLQELNITLSNLQDQKHIIKQQTLVHNELQEKYNNIVATNTKFSSELKAAKETVTTLKINLEKTQERAAMLDNLLAKAEDKLVALGNQNLFLTQERAELAYQLKQFQTCKN